MESTSLKEAWGTFVVDSLALGQDVLKGIRRVMQQFSIPSKLTMPFLHTIYGFFFSLLLTLSFITTNGQESSINIAFLPQGHSILIWSTCILYFWLDWMSVSILFESVRPDRRVPIFFTFIVAIGIAWLTYIGLVSIQDPSLGAWSLAYFLLIAFLYDFLFVDKDALEIFMALPHMPAVLVIRIVVGVYFLLAYCFVYPIDSSSKVTLAVPHLLALCLAAIVSKFMKIAGLSNLSDNG